MSIAWGTIRQESPPHESYFDTCFMHNIGGVSDKGWHDSSSMCYLDKESCHCLSETTPILCIKHVSKYWSEAYFLVLNIMNIYIPNAILCL